MRRVAHLDQIESVVQGVGATSDLEEVSASWRRCTADLLINPDGRAAPHIVTDSELRVSREPLGKAIVYAQEEVDRLYTIVRQEGYVVLLCNTDGIAIHHRGDEALAEQFKYWGIWVGGVWSESVEGTNGIGTCIAEQRPVLVHRDQHFRTRHIGLSCAGAPIFDPTGRLALVLDASSMTSNQSQTLALAATKVAARAVEERLFREWFRNVWTIAAVPSDDSGPALLLAVDGDLRIVGADRVARKTFALDDERLNRGVPLSTAFDHDRSIFRGNRELDVAARFTRAGTDARWHVLMTPPLSGSRGWRSAAALAIHVRPRMSMLRNAPIAESQPPNRGGLSPGVPTGSANTSTPISTRTFASKRWRKWPGCPHTTSRGHSSNRLGCPRIATYCNAASNTPSKCFAIRIFRCRRSHCRRDSPTRATWPDTSAG